MAFATSPLLRLTAARTSPPTKSIATSSTSRRSGRQVVDEGCPYVCIEHAIENERGVTAGREPWAIVDYPFTNLSHGPGVSIYVQLEPSYVA